MKKQSVKIVVEETGVDYFAWSIITDGFFNLPYYRRFIGEPLKSEVMLIQKGHGKWGVDLANLRLSTKASLLRLESGQYDVNNIKKLHYKFGNNTIAALKKPKKYLQHKNKKILIKDLEACWKEFLHLNCLGTVLVWTDMDNNLFTERLKDILLARQVTNDKLQEYLSLLVSPVKPNIQWQEQRQLLRLAKKFKTLSLCIKSKEFYNHCLNYCWIQYGYTGPVLKKNYFSSLLKKAYKLGIYKAYQVHLLQYKNIRKQQVKLGQNLMLNSQERQLFAMAREIVFLKAYRIDIRYYFHWILDTVYKQLSKEFKIPYPWFHYAERDEIIALLNGKEVDVNKSMRRVNYLLRIKDGKTTKFYDFKKGGKILKKIIITDEFKQAEEIKGNVAFAGKVTGTVRIVNYSKDIGKVKKGDILVALATNPDLLPAMYKAAAFVTDSGGITSHAAIVAREMKKPCVIGTRFATKVFKDGDRVEVDATKGIVKKL